MIIFVYDRFGNQIDVLYDFVEFVHDDEIGSFDFIEFMIPGERLTKGDYLLWRDDWSAWHEHLVESCTLAHKNGAVYQKIYAPNSVTELNLSYINERDSYNLPNSTALSRLLENTRWELGTVNNLGNGTLKFYHETIYEGLCDISEIWDGDMTTRITVGTNGVTHRYINHLSKRGEDNGLLFTYGFDLDEVERTVELDCIYTKIHCFGKGEEQQSEDDKKSRYGRRITFASINDGKDYLENNPAMKKYGVIGKDGVLQHAEGTFIWDNVDNPNELLALGVNKLQEVSEPRITYKANIAVLADAGLNYSNVRTGDTVYIRDEVIDERLTGRIVHVRRYLNNAKATEVTLGNVVRTSGDLFRQTRDALAALNKRSTSWDGAASASGEWLDNMIKELNEAMNAVSGFVYWEQGDGITVYDRPKDDNPTMAIQLKGGALRIANSKLSTGEWNWRTFGTGDGFTADVINAGTINADLIRAGVLQDVVGNNVWDLIAGILTTNKMIAHDIIADGSFTCGDSTKKLHIHDGQIDGYSNNTYRGSLDFTAESSTGSPGNGTFRRIYGLKVDSEFIQMLTERIAESSVYFSSGSPSQGDLEIGYISNIRRSGDSLMLTKSTTKIDFWFGRVLSHTTTSASSNLI